ncbi:MAG TPA: hybrid sensor histidine kinase/response regulator, partial [Pseudomonas sp.]|nr:hybrid sensor histidine kinase/response regulator [Pseudomonas sp.]
FTTKEVGKGSGLGLAQVFGFAKQSGGGARIESREGVGTTVKVFLPRTSAPRQPEPASAPSSGSAESNSQHCILLVDDDHSVREVTAQMLEDLGF